MGADIHPFVERWTGKKWISVDPPKQPKLDWSDWGKWSENRVPTDIELLANALTPEDPDFEYEEAQDWHFGRNYDAFSSLAGVRGDTNVFMEPRGLPEDVSIPIRKRNSIRLVESEEEEESGKGATIERMRKWGNGEEPPLFEMEGAKYAEHPDWHSTTYYTLGELEYFLKEYKNSPKRIKELTQEMKKIAKKFKISNDLVRVIMWFDN